jgi:hypothetical protein
MISGNKNIRRDSMSEEFAFSFRAATPSDEVISVNSDLSSNDETSISYHHELQIGQRVQFLKITLQKDRKISYKETYGIITCISDGFVEIEDYLGDVVRSKISNVKKSDSPIFMYTNVEFLNVV